MQFSIFRIIFFPLLALPLLLTSCGPKSTESAAARNESEQNLPPVVGDSLVRNLDAEPQTLNPITASDAYEGIVNGGIYESLVQRDKKTLEMTPLLATSWEVSPDQLTYTFKLRQGIQWHDGKPLTAEDVKYTFDRIKDPKVDCTHLKTYFKDIVSCEIIDPETIRFHSTRKYFKTLETLGFGIIPRHIFDNGEDFNKHSAGRHPIGTGPYIFQKWDTGSQIVVERNADYWGKDLYPNYPGKIVFKILTNPTVTLQLLKRGDIDMYDRIDPTQWVKQLSGAEYDKRFQKFAYDYPLYSYIGFNQRKPPFNELKVRQAIDHLVNRDKIIEIVYQGLASPTSGPFLPKDPSYDQEIKPTKFDPAKAAQLLDEAGWKLSDVDGMRHKGAETLHFTMLLPAESDRGEKISLILQEELKKVGVVMDIRRLEWAVYLQRVNEWQFDAMAMSWSLSLDMDPYQIWHGSQAKIKNSSNSIGFSNAEADKIMDAAREEFDPPRRQAMYRKLHRIIYDDCPVSFVVVPKQLMAVAPRWHNIKLYVPSPCYDVGEWFVPLSEQKYR